LKNDWQSKKLIEISAAISTGPFGSMLHKSDYSDRGVPLVNPINVVGDRIVPDQSKLISKGTKQRLAGYVLAEGDIVVARRGEIGRCAVVGPNESGWICGTGSFFIRPLASTDSRFLAHLIRSPSYREKLEQASTGTTMKNLSNLALRDLVVEIPRLPEQRRIVGILDDTFDGIAVAEANAEKNLQNARALFQSHLQAVFSRRGKGWIDARLGDVCDKVTDGTHITPTYTREGVPFLSVKNLTKGFIDFSDTRFISIEEHQSLTKHCKPVAGDILYTKVGTTGVAQVVDVDEEFSIFVSVALLKVRHEVIFNRYLEHFLNAPYAREQARKRTRGMANKNLVITDIKEIEIHFPESLDEQRLIVTKLDSLATETQRLESIYEQKLTALEALKNSLLHDAFTGAL
jgi:type I restriction enzyme S subunit